MRFVNAEDLRENDKLATALYDENYVLLINSGRLLTTNNIKKIQEKGISGVYIDDTISQGIEIENVISVRLKEKTIQDLKKFNIDLALENAKNIVSALEETTSFCDYINAKTFDNYTYEHSLSVAVFSTLVGIACQYREKELINLALAALLHDLGKRCISSDILNKPDKLTSEEFMEIKKHPFFGYNMLKDDILISATVKTSIYQHHENEDGSGYPRGLKGNDIYKFAKIIHITDVYDAITSKRPYKEPNTPMEAIAFIIKNTGKMFDKEFVELFLGVVPAYPKGLMVKLSNGEKGIVVENYKGYVLRPKIRLMDGEEISLKDDLKYKDITIL